MRVTVLVENCTPTSRLAARHGLSLLLESMGPDGRRRRVPFDFGPDDALLANAAALGVDLRSVDAAVLSHGHYDHGGGLGAYLAATVDAPDPARVHVREGAFSPRVSGTPARNHPVGLDPALADDPRVVTTGLRHELGEGLTLFSVPTASRRHPEPDSNARLFEVCPNSDGAAPVPDEFLHEQSLLVTEAAPGGPAGTRHLLVSGCSHVGILNVNRPRRSMRASTTGAPTTAVTALTGSSTGEKSVRATRSHPQQNTAPESRHAGVTASGRDEPTASRARCGAAMPTNETGPAKAATQAESSPEVPTMARRSRRTSTPTPRANVSPSW